MIGNLIQRLCAHSIRTYAADEGPETRCRVREIDGQMRFEFMFVSPVLLIGDARRGWSDISGGSEQFLEWSESRDGPWNRLQFVDGARTEIFRGDGRYEYWALSIHPLAAKPSQYARLGVHRHARHRNFR